MFLPFNTQEDLPTQLKSTESQRASTASLLMSCTNSATPRRLPRSHHVLESPVHSSNPPNKKYRSSVNGRFPHGMLLIGFSMFSPSWLNILFNQLCWDHTTMFHLPIFLREIYNSLLLHCHTSKTVFIRIFFAVVSKNFKKHMIIMIIFQQFPFTMYQIKKNKLTIFS